MIIYPAIDLKQGACVRLKQGIMDSAVIYNKDPVAQAQIFEDLGSQYLHMVDLDGAFQGQSVNHHAVENILKATALKIQLGGGLRNLDHIARWLDLGVDRVILGSIAVKQPDIAIAAAEKYPHKILIGLDSKNAIVTTDGWAKTANISLLKCADYFKNVPIAGFIHTDIAVDGMLQGVNIEQTMSLAYHVKVPVIASGGIKTLEHIQRVHDTGMIAGVITGKAIYEGHLNLKEALSLFPQ